MNHSNAPTSRVLQDEHQSSIDIIIGSFWRLIKRIFHLKTTPAPWVIILIISIVISLFFFIITIIFEGITLKGIKTILFGCALIFMNFLVSKFTFDQTFRGLKKMFQSDKVSEANKKHLDPWLALVRNIKKPLIIGAIVYTINSAIVFRDPVNSPASLDTVLMGGLMFLWTGFILYFMFILILLPLKLKKCEFKIHEENPASSQFLYHWNKMMNVTAYMFALMLAAGTLFTLSISPFRIRTLFFIVPRWLLLIVLFIVNQIILSQIIVKSKQETFKKIEGEMASLKTEGSGTSKDIVQDVMGMWDYHDRLLKTRNSFLDFKGVVNFISTLLIPLLAFIIANYEEILSLIYSK